MSYLLCRNEAETAISHAVHVSTVRDHRVGCHAPFLVEAISEENRQPSVSRVSNSSSLTARITPAVKRDTDFVEAKSATLCTLSLKLSPMR